MNLNYSKQPTVLNKFLVTENESRKNSRSIPYFNPPVWRSCPVSAVYVKKDSVENRTTYS